MAATTIVAIHVSHANRAGSFLEVRSVAGRLQIHRPSTNDRDIGGRRMPRGRSTFTKRQKEQTRQQRQREKLERRNQRKQEKPAEGSADEMAELREHAAAQAALFNLGVEESDPAEESTPGGGIAD